MGGNANLEWERLFLQSRINVRRQALMEGDREHVHLHNDAILEYEGRLAVISKEQSRESR